MNGLDVFRYMDNLGPSIENVPMPKWICCRKVPMANVPMANVPVPECLQCQNITILKRPSPTTFLCQNIFMTIHSWNQNVYVPEYLGTGLKGKCTETSMGMSSYRAERLMYRNVYVAKMSLAEMLCAETCWNKIKLPKTHCYSK